MAATSSGSFETTRRGRELYERELSAKVESIAANEGKLLALDVDTGDYSLGDSSLAAVRDLKTRRPNARVHVIRVGSPTAIRMGVGRRVSE